MGHCELESPIPQNWMGSLQSNGSRSKKSAVEFKYIRRGRGKKCHVCFSSYCHLFMFFVVKPGIMLMYPYVVLLHIQPSSIVF